MKISDLGQILDGFIEHIRLNHVSSLLLLCGCWEKSKCCIIRFYTKWLTAKLENQIFNNDVNSSKQQLLVCP